MISARQELLAGIRAELPITLGVTPFGLIYGVLATAAGLSPILAIAMSSVVFAGSAQFIGAQLFGVGTPGIIIVLTTFVVNLRHALYSLSVAPYLQRLPARWQWILAYLLTDEAYAVTIIHYRDESKALDHKHWFFLGSGLTLWTVWQLTTIVGVAVGAQIPATWALDFTLALTFIGIIIPTLQDRPNIAAALTAGVVAVLSFDLPYKLGLIIASISGILVGLWMERRA